ncbi:MAG: hypothetical protein HRU80_03070 [Ignavibacteriales bacterium]|nr:MAG: hypothetical protein HRU80_03070 [Ignavibacteriales bacterium]
MIYNSLPDTTDPHLLSENTSYQIKAVLLTSNIVIRFSDEEVTLLPEKICITGETKNNHVEITPENLESYTTIDFSLRRTLNTVIISAALLYLGFIYAWASNN